MENKKSYTRFEVTFNRKNNVSPQKNYFTIRKEYPIEGIDISVWADDINSALQLAWQGVALNPEQYEITAAVALNYNSRWNSFGDDDE